MERRMPRRKSNQIRIAATVLSIMVLAPLVFGATADPGLLVPQESLVVLFVRPQMLQDDPALAAFMADLKPGAPYLKMLDLTTSEIGNLVIFTPFDRRWVTGPNLQAYRTFPVESGFIISGFFNARNKYASLKAHGWKEERHVSKKVLWWSTGEPYLRNPAGGECLAVVQDDKLLLCGSEEAAKKVLDVIGGKSQGLAFDSLYAAASGRFQDNMQMAVCAFAIVTDEMRDVLNSEISSGKTHSGRESNPGLSLLTQYAGRVRQFTGSVEKNGNDFLFNAEFGMDGANSALVVSGLLQLGGGLASLMPQNDPGRAALSGLRVDRRGSIVSIQTRLTRQQLIGLLSQPRR